MEQKIKSYFLYVLTDNEFCLKYIGITDSPISRYKSHLNNKKQDTVKNKWVSKYVGSGNSLKMIIVLKSDSLLYIRNSEKYIIKNCFDRDIPILNNSVKSLDFQNILFEGVDLYSQFSNLISDQSRFKKSELNDNIFTSDFIEDIETFQLQYTRLSVILPQNIILQLKQIADEEGHTLSSICRKIITQYLK